MSSSLSQQVYGAAYCSVDASNAAFFVQRGFDAAIVDNGAGDFTLTLEDAYDFDNCIVTSGVVYGGVAGASITVEILSATQLRVRTATVSVVPAVAAADLDFWLKIEQIAPN